MYDNDREYYEGEDYNVFEEARIYEDHRYEHLDDDEKAHLAFERSYADDPDRHSYDDAEYYRGIAEARQYQFERQIYGEDIAEQLEIEREIRNGW